MTISCWRSPSPMGHAHGGMAGADFELTRRRAAALGIPAAIGPRYFVGVDLGQSRDPTAIAVVRRVLHGILACADAGHGDRGRRPRLRSESGGGALFGELAELIGPESAVAVQAMLRSAE
jgi:hypothetical protein